MKDSKWVSVTAFNSLYYKVLKIVKLSMILKAKHSHKLKSISFTKGPHILLSSLTARITAAFIV